MASVRRSLVDDVTLRQTKGEWGAVERLGATGMFSMVLLVGSLFFLGTLSQSLDADSQPWLLALTSHFQRWDCAALKGTPRLVDALLRAPSIVVPALLCSWNQRLNMPQRLTRLFVLHVMWNLAFGFLLITAGVKLSPPF